MMGADYGEQLPGDLGLIEDVIGREAAIQLGEKFRSTCIYLPKDLNGAKMSRPVRAMCDAIGRPLVARLVNSLGGGWVTIHNLDSIKRRQRNNAIRVEYDAGASVQELALRYRVSVRTVFYVLGSSG